MDHEPCQDRGVQPPDLSLVVDRTRFRDKAHQDAFNTYYRHVLDAVKDGPDGCGCADEDHQLCPEGRRLAEAAR